MLRRVLDAALGSSLDEVIVVLGPEPGRIIRAFPVDPRLRAVVNPRFAAGQSTSLVAGLDAADEAAEAALVLLGDQPEISPAAIDAVIEAWRRSGAAIVQAGYEGGPGHPVLFARIVWPDLRASTGDQGARGFIERNRDMRTVVEVGGPRPEDLDTQEDLQRLLRRFSGRPTEGSSSSGRSP